MLEAHRCRLRIILNAFFEIILTTVLLASVSTKCLECHKNSAVKGRVVNYREGKEKDANKACSFDRPGETEAPR